MPATPQLPLNTYTLAPGSMTFAFSPSSLLLLLGRIHSYRRLALGSSHLGHRPAPMHISATRPQILARATHHPCFTTEEIPGARGYSRHQQRRAAQHSTAQQQQQQHQCPRSTSITGHQRGGSTRPSLLVDECSHRGWASQVGAAPGTGPASPTAQR